MEALKKSPTPSVEMKPSDKGWSWLKGDGITIRIGMEKLDDHGNGSRLGLVIQNPLAVKLKDCSLAVAWSSTDKSGNVIDSTRHAKEFDLDGAFPAGDYAFPPIDLPDLKQSEIGLLTFCGFSRPDEHTSELQSLMRHSYAAVRFEKHESNT